MEYDFKMILESFGVTKYYVSWMIYNLIGLSLGTLPVVLQFLSFSPGSTVQVLSFLIRNIVIHSEYHFGRKLTSL